VSWQQQITDKKLFTKLINPYVFAKQRVSIHDEISEWYIRKTNLMCLLFRLIQSDAYGEKHVTDIASLTTAIGGVKAALEIAKVMREMDKSISESEWKLKIADLMSTLADSQSSLAEIRLLLVDKDAEIQELKEALANKQKVLRDGDAYFEVGDSGELVGSAYCSHCYEVENVLVHITQVPIDRKMAMCPKCNSVVNWRPSKAST